MQRDGCDRTQRSCPQHCFGNLEVYIVKLKTLLKLVLTGKWNEEMTKTHIQHQPKSMHSNLKWLFLPLLLSLMLRGSWEAIASRFCCRACCMILCCSIIIFFCGGSPLSSFSLSCSRAAVWTAMAAAGWLLGVMGRATCLDRQLAIMGSSGGKNQQKSQYMICPCSYTIFTLIYILMKTGSSNHLSKFHFNT